VALVMMGGLGALAYQAGRSLEPSTRGAVRYALLAVIGALVIYDYAALRLPGAGVFRSAGGLWWLATGMVLGAAAAVAVGWYWKRRTGSS
jgi:hypothetical protein